MLVSTGYRSVPFLDRLKKRNHDLERQFAFLRRLFTPRTVFMHYGAQDCALALQAAGYVERVYAVDPLPLQSVAGWIEGYRAFWQTSLARLKRNLEGK